MMQAVAEEVNAQRWGQIEELLALQAEVLHAVYRLTWSTHSGKPYPGKELKIPRPERESKPVEERPPVTIHTWRQAMLGGGRPDGL